MTLDAAEPLGAQRRMNRHRRASADGAGSRPAQWQARDAAAIRREVERAHDEAVERRQFGFFPPDSGNSRPVNPAPGAGAGDDDEEDDDTTTPPAAATTTRPTTTAASTRPLTTSTSASRCQGLLNCIAEPFSE